MFFSLLGIALAFAMVKYREQIIEFSGTFDWAEKYLGHGGSYTAVVLFAIGIFFISLTFLFGEEDSLFGGIGDFIGGR